ncbi:MAG TPA: hypothetical protein VMX13_08095 [Sedimentisphaerales bacterium]|nr:hypothetical protein [Sedimentisphaerales bacterium]
MDKDDRDGQIDDDILQSRKDILRSRDIIPPYNQEPAQEAPRREAGGQKDATGEPAEPAAQEGEVQAGTAEEEPAGPAEPSQKSEIPRFDLAEDIMAEQRRITAIRRKAPAEKKEAQVQELQVEAAGRRFEPVSPGGPQEEKIIAQIVARDIERLLRGEAADV